MSANVSPDFKDEKGISDVLNDWLATQPEEVREVVEEQRVIIAGKVKGMGVQMASSVVMFLYLLYGQNIVLPRVNYFDKRYDKNTARNKRYRDRSKPLSAEEKSRVFSER